MENLNDTNKPSDNAEQELRISDVGYFINSNPDSTGTSVGILAATTSGKGNERNTYT
jgi:hypothetical protein